MRLRITLSVLIAASVLLCLAAVISLFWSCDLAGRLMGTASGLAGLASICQASSSGWFSRSMEVYDDETQFPFGPPSHFVRQTIDNPDRPIRTRIRNKLFFDQTTAIWLASSSLILAIAANWMP